MYVYIYIVKSKYICSRQLFLVRRCQAWRVASFSCPCWASAMRPSTSATLPAHVQRLQQWSKSMSGS